MPLSTRAHWLARGALGAVLLLAIVLHFFRLDQEGFANLYYAATVKSMLMSWRNFFFASFDPGGFVTVDKPPFGFWVQAFSALVFGFRGWSLLLPQALAGVLSVALLYHLVARVFGAWAGVIAALALTVTPISIAANRNNTIDSQLVFALLLAVWALGRALERGRLRWLIVSAILIGIGFNIKMLQAYMVLPAIWLTYLIAARTRWGWRVIHLALATIALIVVSFAWVAVVDLTPPEDRPYVGSSQNNTEMELIVGHNGVARLGAIANMLGLQRAPRQPPGQLARVPAAPAQPRQPIPNQPPSQPPAPPGQPGQPRQPIPNPPRAPGGDETGAPGILRLFNQQLAGQIAWFLPFAILGFVVAAAQTRFHYPFTREQQQLLLWMLWLAPMILFFSFAGLFHRYYLEMLAPALAALVGAGFVALWRAYTRHAARGMILPLALLIGAATQVAILWHWTNWNGWLIPFVIVATLAAALGLIVARIVPAPILLCALIAAFGLLVLFAAPTLWSFTPLLSADSGLPFAGPELATRPARRAELPQDARLIAYLRANRGDAKFLVATTDAKTAAPIILATGEPVMALGGFSGSDPILTRDELAERIALNDVRLFLIPPQNNPSELMRWIIANCARVSYAPPRGLPGAPGGESQLYDCARR